MSLMGLDIGTTGAKATVFAEDGRLLGGAYAEYPLESPRPGWLELDAERVWDAVVDVVRRAAGLAGRDPAAAMAISCLGEAAVPLDASGAVLDRAIIGFDTRASALFDAWIADQDRARIMSLTGQPPSQMVTVVKLMWIRDHQPELFKRIARYPCFGDFACIRMGLPPMIDHTMAARTMGFDIHRRVWSDEMARRCGLDFGVFSPPVATGCVIGELGAKAARTLGLPAGCKVCAGAHDQPAGALGAGVFESGLAMDATGTVECFAVSMEQPVVNTIMMENNLSCYPHAVRDLFISLAFNFTGGSLLRWVRDVLGGEERARAEQERRDVYAVLTEAMSPEPTGLFVVPHFTMTGTPHMDPDPVGAIVGLTLSTSRAELLRAVLEGITYEMKLNLSLLERAGVAVRELRAIGGGAKSDFWLQLKADMFGRPVVRMSVTEAAGLGMAISAGVGAGIYPSVREAVAELIRPGRIFEPNPRNARFYDERLPQYARLYPRLKGWKRGEA